MKAGAISGIVISITIFIILLIWLYFYLNSQPKKIQIEHHTITSDLNQNKSN